ncbi:MAG: hypothetical protein IKS45_05505, partial [Thermoguttaceae bacterium]|nr:hypothetical protein [Thermoguttaceae bacterium]
MRVQTASLILTTILLCAVSCSVTSWIAPPRDKDSKPYSSKSVTRGQLEITGEAPMNDFLPLMDELQATMGDMQDILGLSELSAPTRIHIYTSN